MSILEAKHWFELDVW